MPTALPGEGLLSTGVRLDPAGRSIPLGNMPLNAVLAPGRRFVVMSMSGWREQGLEVVDRDRGVVTQRLGQAGAFLGLAWGTDSTMLYASGGASDMIYEYRWRGTAGAPLQLADSLRLRTDSGYAPGTSYPAGVALSPDGRRLYVAENLSDSLAVVDLATKRVVQRVSTGAYPYAVVAAADGRVFVSDWGASSIHAYHPLANGTLTAERPISVGRHPSAMTLSADGSRLFATSASTDRVAVVDTRARRVLRWLLDPPPEGVAEGATPNALALSSDGMELHVAEADANSVAVFELSPLTSGLPGARGDDGLRGRIPTEWYPTAVLHCGDSLCVVNGKGRGAGPNPTGSQPDQRSRDSDPRSYTLGQLDGTLTMMAVPDGAALAALTARVTRANHWDRQVIRPTYPPIEHVIYILKENRTYDQVLGDLRQADGDSSLVFFPRAVTPNHHALAERFGLYDRFFVNAEVSEQGHAWSMAAYVTDYREKMTPDTYRGKRPEPDVPGEVEEPAAGYLWNAAIARGVSFRNYGEYSEPLPRAWDASDASARSPDVRALLPELQPFTSPTYPPFDMRVADQRRADAWLQEFRGYERAGSMPRFEILHLPNDHLAGTRAGECTPRACMADNDLALGRIIEALSQSAFWSTTAVFVLEDDAQAGPDHVSSHRSVLMTISPWAAGGVLHRFVNTTDVLATIEELLGLPSLSTFDHFGRPLRDIWRDRPDLRPYRALQPTTPLAERNLASAPDARRSSRLDLSHPDEIDDASYNLILWHAVMGAKRPYPAPRRMAMQALVQSLGYEAR